MEVIDEGITTTKDTAPEAEISTIVYTKDPEPEAEVEMAKEPVKLPAFVANLDVCFMLDCTGSMQSHIDKAKNKVKDIIEEVKQQYPESEIQVGIVGYRDITDGKRFEILPFTSNIQSARDFLTAIIAHGGNDFPEDVNGAFQQTLYQMQWQGQAKMVVHIADAPCHGKEYHTSSSDDYPNGHSGDKAWDVMLKELVDQHIDYLFLKIGNGTDKMFEKFKEVVESYEATAKGVLFKQEPISNADQKAAVLVPAASTFSLFTPSTTLFEKKKRAPRKEAPKKEKAAPKVRKSRAERSSSKKASASETPSRSRTRSKKAAKEIESDHEEEEEEETLDEPKYMARRAYNEWKEKQGRRKQKKQGYWTLPDSEGFTSRSGRKKSTARKTSVSKERSRSEKRGKKAAKKSSASKERERSRSKDRKRSEKSSPRKESKKDMEVEKSKSKTTAKRAFIAPKSRSSSKAVRKDVGASLTHMPPGMSAMDESEYFAKLLSREMMGSIHRKTGEEAK